MTNIRVSWKLIFAISTKKAAEIKMHKKRFSRNKEAN